MFIKPQLTITLLSMFLTTSPVWAQEGNTNGGGGNVQCLEYINYIGEISASILKIGQKKAQEMYPTLDVLKVAAVATAVQCKPVDRLDDDNLHAFSYPGIEGRQAPRTDLKHANWALLSVEKKVELGIHELMVMATLEGNYQYQVTRSIVGPIWDRSSYFKDQERSQRQARDKASKSLKIHARETFVNSDGSVTAQGPSALVEGVKFPIAVDYHYSGSMRIATNHSQFDKKMSYFYADDAERGLATGFCRFHGFTQATNYQFQKDLFQMIAMYSPEGRFLGLHESETARIEDEKRNGSYYRTGSIQLVGTSHLVTVTCF